MNDSTETNTLNRKENIYGEKYMRGHGSKFGRKKEAAIAALLSNRTLDEAAREAGVSTRTLIRWQKNPEFDKDWSAAKRESVINANSRLQNGAGPAATVILKMMYDLNVPAATRLNAAKEVRQNI